MYNLNISLLNLFIYLQILILMKIHCLNMYEHFYFCLNLMLFIIIIILAYLVILLSYQNFLLYLSICKMYPNMTICLSLNIHVNYSQNDTFIVLIFDINVILLVFNYGHNLLLNSTKVILNFVQFFLPSIKN
jgi:hypothetical protein